VKADWSKVLHHVVANMLCVAVIVFLISNCVSPVDTQTADIYRDYLCLIVIVFCSCCYCFDL